MLIGPGIFLYIYHVGSNFNLHSIIRNGLVPGGQNLSRRQTVFFLPVDPRNEDHKDPEHIDFSVPRRARYLHSAWKKHQDVVFWVDIDLAIEKRIDILSNSIECKHSPRNTSSLLYYKSCEIEKLEKSCMRNHTCVLDHHQRSHYDTITIGPEGMMNWVLQLNNSQSVNSLDSLVEKFNMKRSPNQPNQNPILFVIDRGNLSTQKMCVVKGETSRSHEIDEKSLHEELVSSDRSGKPDDLSENIRVEQTHDGTGQPVELNSSNAQTVKEQFASEDNRDTALFNTDNEFNRAINEDIDFNISGLPYSAVKQSHGVNVQNLIQKIENHPHRHALQSDLQQRRPFNPFSKESQDMIKAAGNIELCERLDVELKEQCKVCLSYWNVGIVHCTCGHFLRDGSVENKKFVKYTFDLLSIPNYYIKKGRPHGHRYGKKPGDHEYFIANSLKKKCKKKDFLGILDRLIRDERFRKNMIELGRSEDMS